MRRPAPSKRQVPAGERTHEEGAAETCMTRDRGGFSHEALLFAGEEGFLAGTAAFIEQAAARDEPVLAVLGAGRIDSLRAHPRSRR